MTAYRALALLDDTDPAGVHYRLAKLLQPGGQAATRPAAKFSSRSKKRPVPRSPPAPARAGRTKAGDPRTRVPPNPRR